MYLTLPVSAATRRYETRVPSRHGWPGVESSRPADVNTRSLPGLGLEADLEIADHHLFPVLIAPLHGLARVGIVGVLAWCGDCFAPALVANGAAARFQFHDHHQVIQPVSAPAAQPAHVPIAEARPQRDRRAKAKELSFQLHCVDQGSAHSWL
jgi:hypothetical protein